MDARYEGWIAERYRDPDAAEGQCVEACAAMREAFPELSERNGVVWSHRNLDNYGDIPKEYPHRWLQTPQGEIVDPTVSQFCLLGDLLYKEFDLSKGFSRCRGCGQYFSGHGYFCGCEWSD